MSYAHGFEWVMCIIVRCGLAVLRLARIAHVVFVRTAPTRVWVVNVHCTFTEGGARPPFNVVVAMALYTS